MFEYLTRPIVVDESGDSFKAIVYTADGGRIPLDEFVLDGWKLCAITHMPSQPGRSLGVFERDTFSTPAAPARKVSKAGK